MWIKNLFNKLLQRKLVTATLLVSGFVAFAKVLAAVKEIYVAYLFGVSGLLDAYLIALLVATFFVSVIGGGMQSSFIPQFVKVETDEGENAAKKLLVSTFLIFGIGILLIGTLVLIFKGHLLKLIASGFDEQQRIVSGQMVYILSPILFLSCNAVLFTSVLNTKKKYVLPGIAGVLNSLVIMICLFVFGGKMGIYGLAMATLIGYLVEFVILVFALCKNKLIALPSGKIFNHSVMEVLKQCWPALVANLVMAQNPLIDQAMATWLGKGSVSALSFGQKLPALFLTIISMGLTGALLPHFSYIAAIQDKKEVVKNFKNIAKKIFIVGIVLALGLILSSHFLIKLLFERGQFSAQDTMLVATITSCLALQIPFYLVSIVGVRVWAALKMNRWLLVLNIINLAVNVLGNIIFMKFFGVVGIALSTSFLYVVACSFIIFILEREARK